jgi:hypothetical protein
MEEENVRELRSSRSRSATPFFRGSRDRDSTHVPEEVRRVTATAQTKGRWVGVNILLIQITWSVHVNDCYWIISLFCA